MTRWRRRAVVGVAAALVAVPALAVVPSATADPVAAATYCASATVHGPGGAPLEQTSAAQGCRYDTGVVSVTPTIAVSRTGAVFVAKGTGGVVRSLDGEGAWEEIAVPPTAQGDAHDTGHGFVHVDATTDRLFYVTSGGATTSCGSVESGAIGAGAKVSWSDDLGETWQGSTVACDVYDWGKLVTGFHPDGLGQRAVYFFGVAPRLVGGARLTYRSLDGGATWERMANLASATTESGAGVTAPDGTIYFDYPEFIGFDPVTRLTDQTYPFEPGNLCRQMVAVSEDFGETWRQEAIPGSLACNLLYGQQRVAVDDAGTVYAVWNDDVDNRVHLVHSTDKGRTWSEAVDVMPPGTTYNNSHANVVAGEPGHVYIAGVHTSAPVNPRVFIVPTHGEWHAFVTESFNATDPSPRFESVDLDPVGDPTNEGREAPSETEASVAMSPNGVGWATFTRAPAEGGGELTAARMVRTTDCRPRRETPRRAPAPRCPR
jgi:hypothetical protein